MCVLCRVLTISEIALMWCVHERSVRRRLDRGDFVYRVTATGIYLVEYDSVVRIWGEPVNGIKETEVVRMLR